MFKKSINAVLIGAQIAMLPLHAGEFKPKSEVPELEEQYKEPRSEESTVTTPQQPQPTQQRPPSTYEQPSHVKLDIPDVLEDYPGGYEFEQQSPQPPQQPSLTPRRTYKSPPKPTSETQSSQKTPSKAVSTELKQQTANLLAQAQEDPELRISATYDQAIQNYANMIRLSELQSKPNFFWISLNNDIQQNMIDFSKVLAEIKEEYGQLDTLDTYQTNVRPFLDWIHQQEGRISQMRFPEDKINLYKVLENTAQAEGKLAQSDQYNLKIINLLNDEINDLNKKFKTQPSSASELMKQISDLRDEIASRQKSLFFAQQLPTSMLKDFISTLKDKLNSLKTQFDKATESDKKAIQAEVVNQSAQLAIIQAPLGDITQAVQLMSDRRITWVIQNRISELQTRYYKGDSPAELTILQNVLFILPKAQELLNDPLKTQNFNKEMANFFTQLTIPSEPPTLEEAARLATAIAEDNIDYQFGVINSNNKKRGVSLETSQKLFADAFSRAQLMLDQAKSYYQEVEQDNANVSYWLSKLNDSKQQDNRLYRFYNESLVQQALEKNRNVLNGNLETVSQINVKDALGALGGTGPFREKLSKAIDHEQQVKAQLSIVRNDALKASLGAFAILFTVGVITPLTLATLNQQNKL